MQRVYILMFYYFVDFLILLYYINRYKNSGEQNNNKFINILQIIIVYGCYYKCALLYGIIYKVHNSFCIWMYIYAGLISLQKHFTDTITFG